MEWNGTSAIYSGLWLKHRPAAWDFALMGSIKTCPRWVRWVVDLAALGPITAHKCAEYVNSELQWAVAMAIETLPYEPALQLILTR